MEPPWIMTRSRYRWSVKTIKKATFGAMANPQQLEGKKKELWVNEGTGDVIPGTLAMEIGTRTLWRTSVRCGFYVHQPLVRGFPIEIHAHFVLGVRGDNCRGMWGTQHKRKIYACRF